MTSTPQANARAVVNGVLYIVQFDTPLDEALVERIAGQLVTRQLFGQPLTDTIAALRLALDSPDDITGHIPQPHDEATSRAFVSALVERLDPTHPEAQQQETNELTSLDALIRARTLLDRLPPATERVVPVDPAIDHGWCYVVYWTLADSSDAPPPGAGPIVVAKRSGEAGYLGSQELTDELARARVRMTNQSER